MRPSLLVPLSLAALTAAPVASAQDSRPASSASTRAARPPNIVVLVADDLGWGELRADNKQRVPTPNLDALAASGVSCSQAYVTCPVCAPTRAGMLTGRYQQRFGLEFNPGPANRAEEDYGLPKDQKTLAERLVTHGYATGMFGKWHLGYREGVRPTERGFQEFYGFLAGAHGYRARGAQDGQNALLEGTTSRPATSYLTVELARRAAEFIARHEKEPFFLYVPFNAVHAPLQALPRALTAFESVTDEKRKTFMAMLATLDEGVGTVLGELKKRGLEKDTLVLFVSDNGGPTPTTTSSNGPLRGTKAQVWEGGIRVSMYLSWPGRIAAGTVYDAPVSTLDFVPTALAAAGVPVEGEAKLDGVDLVPFVAGKGPGRPHDALFWRFGEQHAARVGDWKLVVTRSGEEMLFDLAADLGEKNDLAAKEPKRLEDLRAAYSGWDKTLVAARWRRG